MAPIQQAPSLKKNHSYPEHQGKDSLLLYFKTQEIALIPHTKLTEKGNKKKFLTNRSI